MLSQIDYLANMFFFWIWVIGGNLSLILNGNWKFMVIPYFFMAFLTWQHRRDNG